MNFDKFYYQYINIPYDAADITRLLEKYPLVESRFQKMEIADLAELLPSIFAWFKENNMEPVQSFLINHAVNFKQDIHIDYTGDPNAPSLALNFPLNSEAAESLTRVYDKLANQQPRPFARHQNGVVFNRLDPQQVVKVTEYKSISPVLLNIRKPHSAWNNTNVLRGVLTFRFKQDPIHLTKE